jgi:hypothetical protein
MLAPPLLGKDGRAHFLWYNQMGFGGPYRLLYSSYDGAAWSPSEEAYRSSSASLTGMLHFDETGAPQVLARTQDVDLILYHTSRTRSGWSAAAQLLTDPFAVWHSWGIAPDGSGGVHLLEDDYSGRFSYSYWKNGVFIVKDRKIAGTAGGRSVQSDGLGNVHLAWMGTISLPGGGANGLSHQCLTGNLLGDRQALSGAQNIEAFRSAADGAAQVLYAWKLQGGRQLGFALLEGCQVKLAKTLDLPPAPFLSRWEGLEAVATSAQPQEVCMLLKISSGEFGLLCAAPAK